MKKITKVLVGACLAVGLATGAAVSPASAATGSYWANCAHPRATINVVPTSKPYGLVSVTAFHPYQGYRLSTVSWHGPGVWYAPYGFVRFSVDTPGSGHY